MRTSHRKHFIRAKASQKGAAYAEQRLIGLIGAGPAVGVTHTAVTMAGYLTGICRRRCAVLEWNDHGVFDRLEEMGIQDGDIVSLYNLEFEYQR